MSFAHLRVLCFAALAVLGGTARPAQAGFVVSYDGGGSQRTGTAYTIGSLIQVGSVDQTLTALGVQDVGLNGLTASTPVGIWNAAGNTLLGSVTVTNADPLTGSYRFHALASAITLSANTQYLIGALVGGTGAEPFLDTFGGSAAYSAGTGFTIVQNRFATGATLAAPVTDGGQTIGRWGAASGLTADSVATPAPPTLIAALFGLGSLAAYRRRLWTSSTVG